MHLRKSDHDHDGHTKRKPRSGGSRAELQVQNTEVRLGPHDVQVRGGEARCGALDDLARDPGRPAAFDRISLQKLSGAEQRDKVAIPLLNAARWAGLMKVARQLYYSFPQQLRAMIGPRLRASVKQTGELFNSGANAMALDAIVSRRCRSAVRIQPFVQDARAPAEWPEIDICVVTYNSDRWIVGFVKSLLAQRFPPDKMHLLIVDNGSTDDTLALLDMLRSEYALALASMTVLHRPNRGFGAGQNTAASHGRSALMLVTNVDLTFEADAIETVVAFATNDYSQTATWELRQKPYEHPKFYDPVTLETNWNSHASVLIRRSHFEAISGYDETIFMYGEDVEISYRLRQKGFLLRYCPRAVVWHFSYESPSQVKPLQYAGTFFSNLYMRLIYGRVKDIMVIPMMVSAILLRSEYDGSRWDICKMLGRLISVTPKAFRHRRHRQSEVPFGFYMWDFEVARKGAFVAAGELPQQQPLVSVVTRTCAGRNQLLRQAMLSVSNQTYRHVEHLIIEDGGNGAASVVESFKGTEIPVHYISMPKLGRSAAGNRGLEEANGEYVVFLDDDDLLFADHIETLVTALAKEPDAVAAYSLAWEVPTNMIDRRSGVYHEEEFVLHKSMDGPLDFQRLMVENLFPIQSVLFRRDLYLERGGLDPSLDALEDWDLWRRYACGKSFVYVPKITSLYRTPASLVLASERARDLKKAHDEVQGRVRPLERCGAS